MLRSITTALFTSMALLVSPLAMADHDPEPAHVARDSYRLADDAQAMAHDTRARNYRISLAADDVHMQASDVYHAARRGFEPTDHETSERIRAEFQDVTRAYNYLAWLMGGYQTRDHDVSYHWSVIQRDYRELYRAVYGVLAKQAD